MGGPRPSFTVSILMFVQHTSLLLIHSLFFLRFSSYVTPMVARVCGFLFFFFFRFLSFQSLVFPCKGDITLTLIFCWNQSHWAYC